MKNTNLALGLSSFYRSGWACWHGDSGDAKEEDQMPWWSRPTTK